MIGLRTYKKRDAEKIASWCRDENVFNLWGGNRFGDFPVSADIINQKYFDNNGDCVEDDNFYPMTAFDDDGVVGHFILRYILGNDKILRMGRVIVDESKRGQKIGREMLRLGLKYAFEIMNANVVTIGVFEHNIPAYKCYLSAGFRKSETLKDSFEEINGESQKIVELEITKEEYFSGSSENEKA